MDVKFTYPGGDPNRIPFGVPVIHVDPDTHALKVYGGTSGGDGGGLTDDELRAEPVAISDPQSASAPSSHDIITTQTSLVLAAGEQGYIRNLNTVPLYVKYGAGASATSFDEVLPGGAANDDGFGGALPIRTFIGTVSVYGASYRYLMYKRTIA